MSMSRALGGQYNISTYDSINSITVMENPTTRVHIRALLVSGALAVFMLCVSSGQTFQSMSSREHPLPDGIGS